MKTTVAPVIAPGVLLTSITFGAQLTHLVKRASQRDQFTCKTRTIKEKVAVRGRSIREGERWETRTRTEESFVLFRKGFTMTFPEKLTVIVGANGCGKTSLIKQLEFPKPALFGGALGALLSNLTEEQLQQKRYAHYLNNGVRELSFARQPDYIVVEREISKNDLVRRYEQENVKGGILHPEHLLTSWDMQGFSNGENNLDFLQSLRGIRNALLVIDEPENSLSIRSKRKVADLLRELSGHNQVIVVTHSEEFMGLVNKVYDLERRRYVDRKKYVQQQYER
jgi:predicted ATPase